MSDFWIGLAAESRSGDRIGTAYSLAITRSIQGRLCLEITGTCQRESSSKPIIIAVPKALPRAPDRLSVWFDLFLVEPEPCGAPRLGLERKKHSQLCGNNHPCQVGMSLVNVHVPYDCRIGESCSHCCRPQGVFRRREIGRDWVG